MAYAYHGGASPLQQQAQIYPQTQQYAQPYPPRSASPRPPQSANPQQIQPGSLTYTTTIESDGQVTYHPFKAIPASYQTAQGVVSGIQWVPAEATSVVPAGATPAGAEFAASFNRPSSGQGSWGRREKEERRYEKEHRYSEEKEYRREREDREYRRDRDRDRDDGGYRPERRRTGEHRDHGGYDKERRYSGSGDDLERRFDDLDLDRERDRDRDHKGYGHGKEKRRDRERERDREYRDREREREYDREKVKPPRGSPYAVAPAVLPGGAQYAAAPYPPGTYPANSPSGGIARPISPYQAGVAPRPASPYLPPAPRPVSPYQAGGPVAPRPVSPYQVGGVGVLPQRSASPYYGGGQRPVSPYHGGGAPVAPRPVSPYAAPRAVSPYQQPAIYPPGHVLEGRPIQGTNVIPRAVSPGMPGPSPYAQGPPGSSPNSYPSNIPRQGYAGASPVAEQQMLASPEGFSRPANLSMPYTPFDTMKIQDMDDFFENIPKMPLVLVPHDIYHEDWIRLMTDLSRAWSGKLPVPEYAREAGPPRRTILTADLVDLWNVSFFFKRGVELVLYKGRERRSGREIGRVDVHLPGFDDYPGDYDSQEDISDDSEDDDVEDRYRYGAYGSSYGRQTESQMHDLEEARQRDRRLREKKRAEKKKRRQEKRHRRRQKEAERKYALYITCVTPLGA